MRVESIETANFSIPNLSFLCCERRPSAEEDLEDLKGARKAVGGENLRLRSPISRVGILKYFVTTEVLTTLSLVEILLQTSF